MHVGLLDEPALRQVVTGDRGRHGVPLLADRSVPPHPGPGRLLDAAVGPIVFAPDDADPNLDLDLAGPGCARRSERSLVEQGSL